MLGRAAHGQGKGVGNGKGKGTGKGKGKGKGKGGKLNVGPWEPPLFSRLEFKSHDHAFYNDFPGGWPVDAA